MGHTLTHHDLTTTPAAGWMSYEELTEEFYETDWSRTPAARAEIPESELPF